MCCNALEPRLQKSAWCRLMSAIRQRGILIGGAAAAAYCGASALAADLAIKAPPAPAPATSCFSSFYNYINSSAQDCPLAWNGITVYGAIDIGVDYMTHGTRFNSFYP